MTINKIRDAFVTGTPFSAGDTQVVRYADDVLLTYKGNVIAKRDIAYDDEIYISWCDLPSLSAVTRRLAPIVKWYLSKTWVSVSTKQGDVVIQIGDSERGEHIFDADSIIRINLSTYEVKRTVGYYII